MAAYARAFRHVGEQDGRAAVHRVLAVRAAARARARAMGYAMPAAGGTPAFMSDADKKKLQDKRKRERQAKKANRKKGKKK